MNDYLVFMKLALRGKMAGWPVEALVFCQLILWKDQRRTIVSANELVTVLEVKMDHVARAVTVLMEKRVIIVRPAQIRDNDELSFTYEIPEIPEGFRVMAALLNQHLKARARRRWLPGITFEQAAGHLAFGRSAAALLNRPDLVEQLCRCAARIGQDRVQELIKAMPECPPPDREAEFFKLYKAARDELFPPPEIK